MNPEDEKLSIKEFAEKHKGEKLEQDGVRGTIIGYGGTAVIICPEGEGWLGREHEMYTFLIPEEECTSALCYGVFLDEAYELITEEEGEYIKEELSNEEFVRQNLDDCFHVDYVEGEWYLVGFDENDNGMLLVNGKGVWEDNTYYGDYRVLTDCTSYGSHTIWSWDITGLTRIDKISLTPQEAPLEDIPVVSEEELLAPLLELSLIHI